jgi:hypothetical protein
VVYVGVKDVVVWFIWKGGVVGEADWADGPLVHSKGTLRGRRIMGASGRSEMVRALVGATGQGRTAWVGASEREVPCSCL